ncbi:BgTH12-02094 [Blumeria graminis f. sp. triticale]|uniref:U4/U6.U5 small nuclear ribonucleoprotein 27kDa protein domain-containing protein n=2 Tax=Blumeria graminis TaxID=34373 RepID=A0A656KL89_BLUGR|nr:hypothetical protein BGT96224_4240 [Blumeria graminis f. sp. tritici 96224]CAD6501848.1 BgTH12-02094 [Blumeria graminis f. sp. triticale]
MDTHRAHRGEPRKGRDESDRRPTGPLGERGAGRERHDDRSRDHYRRYRSRSPRDHRSGRKDGDSRNWGRSREDGDERRGRNRDRNGERDARAGPRERSSSNRRYSGVRVRTGRKESRSRSPRKEQLVVPAREPVSRSREPENPPGLITSPVSFKVGPTSEPDRMEVERRGKKAKADSQLKPVEADEIVVEEEADIAAMKAMMGFGDFNTTHQKKVAGNNISAVRKEKKTEYRQYMNRVGGFNRPLSPSR